MLPFLPLTLSLFIPSSHNSKSQQTLDHMEVWGPSIFPGGLLKRMKLCIETVAFLAVDGKLFMRMCVSLRWWPFEMSCSGSVGQGIAILLYPLIIIAYINQIDMPRLDAWVSTVSKQLTFNTNIDTWPSTWILEYFKNVHQGVPGASQFQRMGDTIWKIKKNSTAVDVEAQKEMHT